MSEDDIGGYYRDLKQIKQAEHQQKSDEIVAKLKADGFEFRLMENGQATIDRNSRQRGRGYTTFKEHIEETMAVKNGSKQNEN